MFKAKVYVTLRPSILDPQGNAVRKGLHALGFTNVEEVRVGKFLELMLDSSSKEVAQKEVEDMCQKLLANLVIENYSFEVLEV